LTAAEAIKVYDCLKGEMTAGYAKSGFKTASHYTGWTNVATRPYVSDTHGGRFVNNYVNGVGEGVYAQYEAGGGKVPVGTILAKDSFAVNAAGHASAGPLFLMEKMHTGFNKATGDWKYSMIMGDGSVMGVTGGKGGKNLQFCADCHNAVAEDQNHLFFLPEDLRK